jgi:hypothetical protein
MGAALPKIMFAKRSRTFLKPLIWTLAGLYLLVDAISVVLLRPTVLWLNQISETLRITAWIRSLGPYASLALFLVPLIVLEPVKLLSAFLIGTGQSSAGVAVLVVGEALKILILERIFHITRPKLMSFPWFAWAYGKIQQAFALLMSLAVVRIARVWMRKIKIYSRWLLSLRRVKPA